MELTRKPLRSESAKRWTNGGSRMTTEPPQWKQRLSAAGVHLFDRRTGLNLLMDEIRVPEALHTRAPRQVSVALTNRCDLACAHCYAPKSRGELAFGDVIAWLAELDAAGTLGVGFGGGEPTLHPRFAELCEKVARSTGLSVSFTTHGHHIDRELSERLHGNVHFIRVSMDGVGATYEAVRRRSFPALVARLADVKTICRFGINVVVNEHTLPDLDDVARIARDAGACELLLLPQLPTRRALAIDGSSLEGLRRWVESYGGPLKLCINESSSEGFPTCDPLTNECGLRAYAHIDATGVLKESSYSRAGVCVGEVGVMSALCQLAEKLRGNDA